MIAQSGRGPLVRRIQDKQNTCGSARPRMHLSISEDMIDKMALKLSRVRYIRPLVPDM